MVLSKLETGGRVGDQAFEAIQEAILTGQLPAGRKLRIRPLAEDLGISVMPVREAIKRLEELGLVAAEPYRGAVVKRFTAEELLHSYAVRRLLEIEAARLGAASANGDVLERLRAARIEAGTALDERRSVDYVVADETFLGALYEASGNPVLNESIATLWRRCRSYKVMGVQRELEAGTTDVLCVHQDRLLSAVERKDADDAARITAESLDAAIARIRDALDGRQN